MDMGFFRRGRGQAVSRSSAPFDFGMLTASLRAVQAATLTARMQAQAPGATEEKPELGQMALVELLTAGPAWQTAVREQGGSFNARFARERGSDD